MLQEFKKSLIIIAIFTALCGLAYPYTINGIGKYIFSSQANGSLIYKGHTPIGSELIAQNFTKPEYFHPRPSAAGNNGFDATSSGGSNYGYTSQKLHDTIKDRVKIYRTENHLSKTQLVPMDAVTASASGLDPHISIENAMIQAKRVAQSRKVDESKIDEIVHKNILKPYFGIIGQEKVNVLNLNLALDKVLGKA